LSSLLQNHLIFHEHAIGTCCCSIITYLAMVFEQCRLCTWDWSLQQCFSSMQKQTPIKPWWGGASLPHN